MICTAALTNHALEIVSLPACILDMQGNIVFVNRSWRALTTECTALRELSLEGTGFAVACERSGMLEGGPALAAAVRQSISSPRDNVSLQLMCRDAGGRRWFEARVAALPQDSAGYLVTCEDITERRKAERRLRRFRAVERARRRQATQHALLAHFGQFALENPPIGELSTQAIEVIRSGLGIEMCRLLRNGPDDHILLHVAGSGWDESWVHAQQFDAVVETENRFVLGTRESIVLSDYSR
jgi:PAS domain-containing protein